MLYLAGQILAYVLVAMVIGAALAWVFLIAPLRRQLRAGRQDQQPGSSTAATDGAEVTRPTSIFGRSGDAPVVALGRPAVGSAGEPAGTTPAVPALAESTPTEKPVPVGESVPVGGPVPVEVPALVEQPEPVGEPSALAALPAVDESAVDESGPSAPAVGEHAASMAVVDAQAGAAWVPAEPSTGAELAVTGPITLPLRMVRAVEPVAELVDLLRRQRDDAALERADLTARLAVAEQRAAEAEQRIFAAERHAITASARVEEIDSALRARVEAVTRPIPEVEPSSVELEVEPSAQAGPAVVGTEPSETPAAADDGTLDEDRSAPPTGPTVAELVRAAEQLRQQLDEAEGRAAKFSSRLAMARTEAEDAQRQVVNLNTRLDRHQAEWAAERQSLLGRISRSETALSVQPATGDVGEPSAAVEPTVVPEQAAVLEPAVPAEAAEDVTPAAVLASMADTEVAVEVPAARSRPTGAATKERPSTVAGAPVHNPTGLATSPGARRGATGQQAAGGRVVMESSPRWNGLLDPSATGGDNLKEIVGVGPVIESRLRTLGITTFGQLAEMGDMDVERLARMLDGFGDRIISDDWVGQAQDLQVRHYGGV
ncbi:hypothetical protein [Frankia sp. R82]|uniref:hypothetical protein n=1 Tax=Frankia sp. R82 TaxID=2950553 RepID=UPI0020435904|nr:hypothetical protein [Frankia sp. R82]MCM3886755.1 hypothetical protein [Frankia sp. R82]